MNALTFRAWLKEMDFTDAAAAKALGIGSRNTIAKYRAEGAPLHIALACAALAEGLEPWERTPFRIDSGNAGGA